MDPLERVGLTRDQVIRMLSSKPSSNNRNQAAGSTQAAVIRLHGLGLSDAQIARQLKITSETVSRLLGYN